MSRSGNEMILELAGLLKTDTVKTAAKKDDKDDDKKEDKKDKAKEKAEEKAEEKAKEKAEKKEDKKASVMLSVIQDLVKLASELDDVGAEEASGLVDDALKVIVDGLEKKKVAHLSEEVYSEEDDITESFEEDTGASGREEGMGSRTLQEGDDAQPRQEDTLEGQSMHDFSGSGGTDPKDKLSEDERATLEELLGKMRS